MRIEAIAERYTEERARFVKYSYLAIEQWEKTGQLRSGVPKIHVIQGVRDRFSSEKEKELWQGYDGEYRIKMIEEALSLLEKRGLISVILDKNGQGNIRYRITRTT